MPAKFSNKSPIRLPLADREEKLSIYTSGFCMYNLIGKNNTLDHEYANEDIKVNICRHPFAGWAMGLAASSSLVR